MANLNLEKLIKDTTEQLVATLAKAEAPLAKADPGKEAPAEKKPEGSSSEGSKDGGQTAESAPHSEPDGDEGKPGPGDGDADNSAPPTAPAPDAPDAGATEGTSDEGSPAGAPDAGGDMGDPATDTGDSVGSLEEQYCALPPNELQVHMTALVSAIGKLLGGTAGMAPAAPAAPAPDATPAPAASPPAPTPPPAMGKKEFPIGDGSGGEVSAGKMAKSEKAFEVRLQALEKSLKEKDAQIASLTEKEAKFNQAAQSLTEVLKKTEQGRKAITGGTFVPDAKAKTITLTRPEVIAKCNQLSANPNLAKSDREAINKYVAGGQPVTVIAHLLDK